KSISVCCLENSIDIFHHAYHFSRKKITLIFFSYHIRRAEKLQGHTLGYHTDTPTGIILLLCERTSRYKFIIKELKPVISNRPHKIVEYLIRSGQVTRGLGNATIPSNLFYTREL